MPGRVLKSHEGGEPTQGKEPYFSITDLVLLAFLAALGLATKSVVYPMVTMVAVPLYLPAGSIAGGIYMIWLIMARGVVNKPGAALACALVQGFVAFLTPFGKHGAWTFLIYIAPGVMIANDYHPGCPESSECMQGPVLKRGCRIGVNTTILPYVTIGEGTLVGSGSVVTKDLPPGVLAYGNPAIVHAELGDLRCKTGRREAPYL